MLWRSLLRTGRSEDPLETGRPHLSHWFSRAVVAQVFNPSTWEAETGGFLSSRSAWSTDRVPGQLGLHRETLYQKLNKKKKKKKVTDSATHCQEKAPPPQTTLSQIRNRTFCSPGFYTKQPLLRMSFCLFKAGFHSVARLALNSRQCSRFSLPNTGITSVYTCIITMCVFF